MPKSLIPVDLHARSERLLKQERELGARLAELEERVRRFEDFERPAYEAWVQVELGPMLASLDELHQQIYERRLQAQRTVARMEGKQAEKDSDLEREARRRAKLDAKREARKEKKREKKEETAREKQETSSGGGGNQDSPSRSLVSLYRSLARRLHPDSSDLIQGLPRARILGLWMEVQNAYDSGNAERLLAILAWLGDGSGASPAALSYSDRMARIKAMRIACTQLSRKISELEVHPAWEFENMRGSERRRLRQQAARQLEDEMARTQEVLEQLEDFLKAVKRAKGMGGRRR